MSKSTSNKDQDEAISSSKKRGRRKNYKSLTFTNKASVDDYGPAFVYEAASHTQHPGRAFDDVDSDLSRERNASRGKSAFSEDRAHFASRDAWDNLSMSK